MTVLPTLLQHALAAQSAERACDGRLHPRIHKKLWQDTSAARKALSAEYPNLEEWLFGYPYRNQSERLAELQRLVDAAIAAAEGGVR